MADGARLGHSSVLTLASWSKGPNSFWGNYKDSGLHLEPEAAADLYSGSPRSSLIYLKGLNEPPGQVWFPWRRNSRTKHSWFLYLDEGQVSS